MTSGPSQPIRTTLDHAFGRIELRAIQQLEAILRVPLIQEARLVRTRDGIDVSEARAAHERLDLGRSRPAADAAHPPRLGWAEVGVEPLIGAAAAVIEEEGQILGEGEHRLVGAPLLNVQGDRIAGPPTISRIRRETGGCTATYVSRIAAMSATAILLVRSLTVRSVGARREWCLSWGAAAVGAPHPLMPLGGGTIEEAPMPRGLDKADTGSRRSVTLPGVA